MGFFLGLIKTWAVMLSLIVLVPSVLLFTPWFWESSLKQIYELVVTGTLVGLTQAFLVAFVGVVVTKVVGTAIVKIYALRNGQLKDAKLTEIKIFPL